MKNYKSIYDQTSDSNSLEQRFYIKKEALRGQFAAPLGTDFLYTLAGGAISASQEVMSSAHRSGRHNNNFIKEKRVEEFSLTTYFNILKTALNGNAAIDTAVKTLWESALGRTEVTLADEFVADAKTSPNITFTMIEVGDSWSKQLIGGFIESFEIQLAGDGQAQGNWTGAGGGVNLVGMGMSTEDNDGGNTIELQAGEGIRFPIGSKIMLIEADGETRSADTPNNTFRTVTAVTGDIITVDGVPLADANGSALGVPLYVVYYEPVGATGIDAPETGLVGEIISSDLPTGYCFRNLTISGTNNHERVNYCFGEDGLDSPYFIPAGRLDVTVSAELNLSKKLVGFYNKVVQNEGIDILAILGDGATRHYQFELPRVIFNIPSIDVPESGSIPVTFEGMAYQTVLDAGDEITVTVA